MLRRFLFATGICVLWATLEVCAQSIDFGVVTGVSLTDDFRPKTLTSLNASVEATNASKWWLLGPSLRLQLGSRVAFQVDAIHRTVRSRQLTTFLPPLL